MSLLISHLVGLINLHVGLLAKLGLWSFSVMNASLSAVMSTLSSMPSFVATFKTLYFLCIEHCTTEKSKHRLTIYIYIYIYIYSELH